MCRKGFHSQELVRIAWSHGFAMTPIELIPIHKSMSGMYLHPVWDYQEGTFFKRFKRVIKTSEGIIEGRNDRCAHAMFFRAGVVYDPDSDVYEYSREECERRGFYGNRLWLFTKWKLA